MITCIPSGSDDIHGNADDLITTSIFDIHGRVTSTYSTDVNRTSIYGASSGEYETQENVKNNIKTVTTVGGAASNYIFNGGFEKGFIGWAELNDNVYRVASSDSLRGNYHIRFDPTPDTPAMMEQCVYLAEGEYTLSWDVSSYGTERLCMWVHAIPLDGTGETQTKQVSLNEENATDGFVNISLNITASDYNGTGGERFKIRFYASTAYTDYDAPLEAPYILIDNIMLEECLGQSGYSMVEFGNFEDFHRQQSYAYDDYWGSAAVVEYANDLLGNVLVLDPNATTPQTTATQTVYTSSDFAGTATASTFTVSAMGRGTYQVASGFFGIKVSVTYGDDTTDVFEVPFENMNNNWQFTSKMITTEEKTIKEIKVIAAYEGNPGVGYFDNIYLTQIVSDDTVKTQYYSNGLVYAVENGYDRIEYEYDAAGNLVSKKNSRNQMYIYSYDEYNRPTYESYYIYKYSISDQKYVWELQSRRSYGYNQYGQVLSNSIEDKYAAIAYDQGEIMYTLYTYNTTAGSRLFGALLTTTNSLGYTTQYFYDSATGHLMAELNTETDTGMCYTYDLLGNITSAMPANMTSSSSYAAVTNAEVVDYTYNDANLLQSITTDSTTYNFTYDAFGNSSSVAIGTGQIVSYEYYSNNGKLHYLHYGNGISVEYKYDALERVSEVWYSAGSTWVQAYAYRYNAYGQLHEFQNLLTDRNVLYSYDANNRMIGHVEYETQEDGSVTYKVNTFAAKYTYDEKSQLTDIRYSLDYKKGLFETSTAEYGYQYTYDDDGLLQNYQILANISGSITYTYDDFMRATTKVLGIVGQGFSNTITYQYAAEEQDSDYYGPLYSSLQVDTYRSTVGTTTTTYTYTYDAKGNITTITGGGYVYRYVYDDLGQLIREDNSALNKTYVFTYDNAGNRLTKTEYSLTAAGEPPTGGTTFAYAYNNASWGDQLTSYQGVAFIYDEIGNPEMYYNGTSWEFSWSQGRRLATAYNGTTAIHFQYNDEGIRTQKDVQGRVHTYRLDDSRIIVEEVGNQTFVYLYDADGSPIGMQYVTAEGAFETCWFEKNLQGDIVAVYNSSGAKLVSYKYDAWGNFTTTYHNGCTASSIAAQNPFRYRGYYYDADLEMYYLQSRYYDPVVGRFINADVYVSTGQGILGNNMYAYCHNNPIAYVDVSGEFISAFLLASVIGGAIAGALINTTSYLYGMQQSGENPTWGGAILAFSFGAVAGGLGGAAGTVSAVGTAWLLSGAAGLVSAGYTVLTTDGSTGQKICAGVSSFAFTTIGSFAGSKINLKEMPFGMTVGGNFLFGFTIGGYLEMANVGVQNGISGLFENDSKSAPDWSSSETCPLGRGAQLYYSVFAKYLPGCE